MAGYDLTGITPPAGGGGGGGDASAANQTTIIGHVDGIEGALGAASLVFTEIGNAGGANAGVDAYHGFALYNPTASEIVLSFHNGGANTDPLVDMVAIAPDQSVNRFLGAKPSDGIAVSQLFVEEITGVTTDLVGSIITVGI